MNDDRVEWLVGEVVQLDPVKTKNKMFAGCLAVVTEIKPWGVLCYVQCIGENGEPGGQAHYRAERDTFEGIGAQAPWRLK